MNTEDSEEIHVDLTEDEESQNWMSSMPESRPRFTEMSEEDASQRLKEVTGKLKQLYIEETTEYIIENAPKDYLEGRGLEGILRDSLFIVETTFDNDYSNLDTSTAVEERLDDIGYDLEAIN